MDFFGVCVLYFSVTSYSPLLELNSYVISDSEIIPTRCNNCVYSSQFAQILSSYVIVRCSASDLDNEPPLRAYSGWKSMDNYDTCASVFVVLFNGFMSLTSEFDVTYSY